MTKNFKCTVCAKQFSITTGHRCNEYKRMVVFGLIPSLPEACHGKSQGVRCSACANNPACPTCGSVYVVWENFNGQNSVSSPK